MDQAHTMMTIEDGPGFCAYTFLLFDLLMTDSVVTLGIAMA
jgi:hypothetical protein